MTLPEVYGDDADDAPQEPDVSRRSRGVALLLSFFGGIFGLHRFYVDKPGTAIAMIFTFGGGGIWYLYDLVLIAAGEVPDGDALPLRRWCRAGMPLTQHHLARAGRP